MADFSTTYMGLKLKSPIIIGSSGLTNSVEKIQEMELAGAGAVVLKSLFEEQIKHDIRRVYAHEGMAGAYSEADDYIANYSREHKVEEYLNLIRNCKESTSFPIIASVNCVSASEWISFSKKIELAGADALELNVFVLPSDVAKEASEYQKLYYELLEKVKKEIKIPVAMKISSYFTDLGNMVKKLGWSGANGVVLFNRFFSPDIDIEKKRMAVGGIYSSPDEIVTSLRWIGLLAGNVQVDLCASTGVHDGAGVVKQILAGAKAVQVCSAIYQKGIPHIKLMNDEIKSWMERNKYERISDFAGIMSSKALGSSSSFFRVQFMKHFAGIE